MRINEDEEFEKLTQELGRVGDGDGIEEEDAENILTSLKDELSQLANIEGQVTSNKYPFATTTMNTAQTSPAPKQYDQHLKGQWSSQKGERWEGMVSHSEYQDDRI